MGRHEPITLARECPVIEIPSGNRRSLGSGAVVRIVQSLGGSFTITDQRGQMYRVDAAGADALGLAPPPEGQAPAGPDSGFSEKLVWDQLKTIYDPEIPVNLIDLGLIYSCDILLLDSGKHRIDVKMSMTAPGCGMANVLKADVETKLARLPAVAEVRVEVVFDPPWTPARMSEAARLQLGLDLEENPPQSPLPIFRSPK